MINKILDEMAKKRKDAWLLATTIIGLVLLAGTVLGLIIVKMC